MDQDQNCFENNWPYKIMVKNLYLFPWLYESQIFVCQIHRGSVYGDSFILLNEESSSVYKPLCVHGIVNSTEMSISEGLHLSIALMY